METRVMKIMWTIAALAGSVTLVDAQQTTPRVPPPASPAPTARPSRVTTPEPVRAPSGQSLLPGIDWLLEPPGAMTLLAPGQTGLTPLPPFPSLEPLVAIAPMAVEFPSVLAWPNVEFTPMPGQSLIEFPPLPDRKSVV